MKEINKMVDTAPCLRDKVILQFYADTGCRTSELLRIKEENIDLKKQIVLIPHLKVGTRKKCPGCGKAAGKNQPFCSRCGASLTDTKADGVLDRRRLISVGPKTAKLLKQYLESRVEVGERPKDGLLVNLNRTSVYRVVRAAAERIGLTGKCIMNPETNGDHYVHTHNFRDSLAVDWLRFAGSDISRQKALQEHLGHQRFETTMRYHKLEPGEIQKIGNEMREQRGSDD